MGSYPGGVTSFLVRHTEEDGAARFLGGPHATVPAMVLPFDNLPLLLGDHLLHSTRDKICRRNLWIFFHNPIPRTGA